MHVVCAMDKFRGTLTAAEAVAAAAAGVRDAVWEVTTDEIPLADGGEGFLDVLGGPNRTTMVTGPLGEPVEAQWRASRRAAVIEMARASGLLIAGGAEGNDPIGATTAGTGELIAEAVVTGSKRVLLGVGGSATTDGGLGAIRALEPHARLKGVDIVVACDVRTRFVDAATVFGPQKGASAAQVELLRRRLERLAQVYESDFGVDVREVPGAGAAGGLAGGLHALGAELVNGFDVIVDELDLDETIAAADLVITGEGRVDEGSFDGKAVGGVAELAAETGVPVLVVAGVVDPEVSDRLPTLSLAELYGGEAALTQAGDLVRQAVADHLRS
ncbi:MAG: glycerate kinase [Actinomycetota bacterium]